MSQFRKADSNNERLRRRRKNKTKNFCIDLPPGRGRVCHYPIGLRVDRSRKLKMTPVGQQGVSARNTWNRVSVPKSKTKLTEYSWKRGALIRFYVAARTADSLGVETSNRVGCATRTWTSRVLQMSIPNQGLPMRLSQAQVRDYRVLLSRVGGSPRTRRGIGG